MTLEDMLRIFFKFRKGGGGGQEPKNNIWFSCATK